MVQQKWRKVFFLHFNMPFNVNLIIEFGPKLGWVAISKGRFHPASAWNLPKSMVDFLVVLGRGEVDLSSKHW